MYIGISLIALSWQPLLLTISGTVLNLAIHLMNWVVKFFDNLPYAVIDGIYINSIQCILLVISIASLAFFLSFKRKIFVTALLISLIAIFSINTLRIHSISSHKEFGIFGVKRAFFAYFIENGTGFSIKDTASLNRSFDFNTKNCLIKRGIRSEQRLTSYSLTDTLPNHYKGILLFAGKRIALSSQLTTDSNFSATPLKVDYLYITEKQKAKPETILSCYSPAEIVIANNLPQTTIDSWIKIAETKQIPCHNIKTDGVFCKKTDPSIPESLHSGHNR
jgi:competence protein ComEC